MLIDFAVQHPRAIVGLVPDLEPVLRAHDIAEGDLSDLFAQRHFGALRERFTSSIGDLVARELLEETAGRSSASIELRITTRGRDAAELFLSSMAVTIRSLARVISDGWGTRNVERLVSEIRTSIPDESDRLAGLVRPFGGWVDEAAL